MINMKALISITEPVQSGYRVAQVEPNGNIFPVAEGLFWVDCSDDCVADQFWYNPADQTIKSIPKPVVDTVNVVQPITQGAQDL